MKHSLRFGLFVIGVALFSTVVGAHLGVVKTLPENGSTLREPPERVRVWFNQQPSPRISRLEVRGPAGDVPLDGFEVNGEERSISARVKAVLQPGSYEVTWRAAGDDGHVMRGSFEFSVSPSE
jgi:methionine-rich copper-binding protein CopC